MKKILLTPTILFLLSLFPLWSVDFHIPDQIHPGEILTVLVRECRPDDSVRFILVDQEGKKQALVEGIPFKDTDLTGENRLGLIGMDSSLPVGNYTVRAEVESPVRSLEFHKPLLVRTTDFRSEDIPLNQAMSDLRSSDDPEKLAQSRKLWSVLAGVTPGEASVSPLMISPVEDYIMTSWFGDRRRFLYSDGGVGSSVHTGVDMAADTGTPILAPLAGKVVMAEFRILTGNSVVLEHFPGIYSLYYHMDSLDVEEGQELVQGDRIGDLGSTGLVTGPHLHWELRVNTIPVDPMKYLERGLIDKDEIMNMIDSTIQEGR